MDSPDSTSFPWPAASSRPISVRWSPTHSRDAHPDTTHSRKTRESHLLINYSSNHSFNMTRFASNATSDRSDGDIRFLGRPSFSRSIAIRVEESISRTYIPINASLEIDSTLPTRPYLAGKKIPLGAMFRTSDFSRAIHDVTSLACRCVVKCTDNTKNLYFALLRAAFAHNAIDQSAN